MGRQMPQLGLVWSIGPGAASTALPQTSVSGGYGPLVPVPAVQPLASLAFRLGHGTNGAASAIPNLLGN